MVISIQQFPINLNKHTLSDTYYIVLILKLLKTVKGHQNESHIKQIHI